ncbi:GntR family transcriptional regulator [Mesorhizobium sp. CAU 1741]|uniref:GntR family transcriptional regulator n=1 Tax=Mesorhizobium sp. CAU 1741 TaxID=3140366 RepID=UPI00325AC432
MAYVTGQVSQRTNSGNADAERSLGHKAMADIRSDILTLTLAPGEPITERFLEARHGVSRTVIRQALTELIRDGFVLKGERGYIVAPFDLKQLEEIFEYREIVEDAAIRLACARATPEAIDAIRVSIDRGLTDFTPEAWFKVGLDVHVQLAALSGNRFMRDAVQDAVNRTLRARWLVASSAEMRAVAHREHSAIVELVREGRAEDAANAVRAHARDVRLQIIQALEDARRLLGARGFASMPKSAAQPGGNPTPSGQSSPDSAGWQPR